MNEYYSPLKLHVLDVGHGDSLVLEFPDGIHHGIIDCSYKIESNEDTKGNKSQTKHKALEYFRDLVKKDISPIVEFACLTHPHLDHYRGYGHLLQGLKELKIPIRELWDFGISAKKARAIMQLADIPEFKEIKDETAKFMAAKCDLINSGVEYKILVNPTKRFYRNHEIEFDLLAPHANQYEAYSNYLGCQTASERQKYSLYLKERRCFTNDNLTCRCVADDNVISSALLIKYRDFRLLLAGDITNCSWRGILSRSELIDPCCQCIKVSHHGSIEGNFPYLEKSLWHVISLTDKKLVAVISGGYRVNLPHADTINSLRNAQCDIYCTGPFSRVALRPYVPAGECQPIVQILMEKICFVEDFGGDANIVKEVDGGHGDITVKCYPNGACKVVCERPSKTPA